MTLVFNDPPGGPCYHEYIDKVFFKGLRQWLHANGKAVIGDDCLEKIRNATVLTSADYLNPRTIHILKNNGNKIVGFSVTDSSYISQSCRSAASMSQIDLIFAATGLQKVNEGHEFVVDQDFNVSLEKRRFLPDDDWAVFDGIRKSGRLQSLPYVHWHRLPEQPVRPYSQRSQKVIMRGGLHARRFILALFLMRQDLLDVNSGFVTSPYFSEVMNPQFQYCQECRKEFRASGSRYPYVEGRTASDCNSPARIGLAPDWSLKDLGQWNNRCPRSFYWMTEQFERRQQPRYGKLDRAMIEKLVNAQWLTAEAHQELLGRITFTSDLKWLFSIYMAQRFWDAAAAGCMNALPRRTNDQEYFPYMEEGQHYITFRDDMTALQGSMHTTESEYNEITKNTRAIYDQWIRPQEFVLNTNLCRHIIELVEKHCA